MRGTGTGSFVQTAAIQVEGNAQVGRLIDMDGDGAVDLVTNLENHPLVAVLHGDGSGGFDEPILFNFNPNNHALAVEDFDGSGTPDIVGSSSLFGAPVTEVIWNRLLD